MNLAVTVWGNRVSPVFDVARTLLVTRTGDKKILEKRYVSFDPGAPADLIHILKKLKVDILVCGAISASPATLIMDHKIRLISFATGNALALLETLARKKSLEKDFIMPGMANGHDPLPAAPDSRV